MCYVDMVINHGSWTIKWGRSKQTNDDGCLQIVIKSKSMSKANWNYNKRMGELQRKSEGLSARAKNMMLITNKNFLKVTLIISGVGDVSKDHLDEQKWMIKFYDHCVLSEP